MEKFFNKLVRDKIPNIIENNNEIAITKILNEEEFKIELIKKLQEECDEVVNAKSGDELLEELADVLEILKALAKLENKSINDVIDIADKKVKKEEVLKKEFF